MRHRQRDIYLQDRGSLRVVPQNVADRGGEVHFLAEVDAEIHCSGRGFKRGAYKTVTVKKGVLCRLIFLQS